MGRQFWGYIRMFKAFYINQQWIVLFYSEQYN